MSCVHLSCPKCYESYEIPEEILDSFDKFKCSHCNFIEQKSFYSPKMVAKSEEEKLEISDSSINSDFVNNKISKEKVHNIPVQNISLNNKADGGSSNEVIKNIIIMVAALALLSGFVFLIVRK